MHQSLENDAPPPVLIGSDQEPPTTNEWPSDPPFQQAYSTPQQAPFEGAMSSIPYPSFDRLQPFTHTIPSAPPPQAITNPWWDVIPTFQQTYSTPHHAPFEGAMSSIPYPSSNRLQRSTIPSAPPPQALTNPGWQGIPPFQQAYSNPQHAPFEGAMSSIPYPSSDRLQHFTIPSAPPPQAITNPWSHGMPASQQTYSTQQVTRTIELLESERPTASMQYNTFESVQPPTNMSSARRSRPKPRNHKHHSTTPEMNTPQSHTTPTATLFNLDENSYAALRRRLWIPGSGLPATIICRWTGCFESVPSTEIQQHYTVHHKVGTTVRCRWTDEEYETICDTSVAKYNYREHVLGVHLKAGQGHCRACRSPVHHFRSMARHLKHCLRGRTCDDMWEKFRLKIVPQENDPAWNCLVPE